MLVKWAVAREWIPGASRFCGCIHLLLLIIDIYGRQSLLSLTKQRFLAKSSFRWLFLSFFSGVFRFEVRLPMTDCVPSSSIRTLLLIENRLMREALARLFRKRPDLIVVGQTSPADEPLLAFLGLHSNVLVAQAFLAVRRRQAFASKR